MPVCLSVSLSIVIALGHSVLCSSGVDAFSLSPHKLHATVLTHSLSFLPFLLTINYFDFRSELLHTIM